MVYAAPVTGSLTQLPGLSSQPARLQCLSPGQHRGSPPPPPRTAGSAPFQEHHHMGYPLLGPSLQLLKLGVIFAAFLGVWRDLASSL